jgi:hypothetical protein
MFFVTLHKPYKGQVDTTLIRADLILEVTTRRHKKKDDDYIPFPGDRPTEPGVPIGAWILVDRLGWTPCIETPEEVALAVVTAEVEYRRRLEAAKTG